MSDANLIVCATVRFTLSQERSTVEVVIASRLLDIVYTTTICSQIELFNSVCLLSLSTESYRCGFENRGILVDCVVILLL